jgi:hypothetical protein
MSTSVPKIEVRASNHEYFGLPSIQDAHARLTAQSDTAQELATSQHNAIGLDELLQNPDLLLEPKNLVAAYEKSLDLAVEPGHVTNEEEEKIRYLHQFVVREVAGPEAVAAIASTIVDKTKHDLIETVTQAESMVSLLQTELGDSRVAMQPLESFVGPARSSIQTIRELLNQGHLQSDTNYWQGQLRILSEFAETYARAKHTIDAKEVTIEDSSRRIYTNVEQADNDLRPKRQALITHADEALMDPLLTSAEVADAVQRRGTRTISEHKAQCEREYSTQKSELDTIISGHIQLVQSSTELWNIIYNSNASGIFPHERDIVDAANNVQHYIYAAMENDSMMRPLQEMLDQAEISTNHIEAALHSSNQNRVVVGKYIGVLEEQLRSFDQSLQQ